MTQERYKHLTDEQLYGKGGPLYKKKFIPAAQPQPRNTPREFDLTQPEASLSCEITETLKGGTELKAEISGVGSLLQDDFIILPDPDVPDSTKRFKIASMIMSPDRSRSVLVTLTPAPPKSPPTP